MDDQRIGVVIRAVRVRKGWRQLDVARKAGLSIGLISGVERGRIGGVTVKALRGICSVLDIRLDLIARWQGGELERLLNARHNQLGEQVAALLVSLGWEVLPEVSFSIYGERGVVDLMAWHAPTRTLLIVELKTEIVDPQELLATLGRKSRLASRIGGDHGWQPAFIATWLVVTDATSNRRRVAQFRAMLGARLPADGRAMRAWLRRPAGPIAGLSFYSDFSHISLKHKPAPTKRVRRPRSDAAERDRAGAQLH